MPSKNIIKEYVSEAYYHVYNRGVAKQDIFLDEQDYKTFLSYLKTYLCQQDEVKKIAPTRQLRNFYEELILLAYCLMPNHFHLMVWQKDLNSMARFMRSIGTKYSRYFNKKYHRVGPIFQSRYKAVLVTEENQFIYLSKYIHRNPLPVRPTRTDLVGLKRYKYSSYQNYLRLFSQTWVNCTEILSYFSKFNPKTTYKSFVEEVDERDLFLIKDVMLDFE
ncbi:MAG: transposase [Patescibacteria group bacterium]|nr:transposase [Patescibacteria group bacterium]